MTLTSPMCPVAGTLPIFLRSKGTADWGDYEQNLPGLYRLANYPELYVLGAHGEGRRQIQVLNRYDDCCFAGTRAGLYEEEVREAVARLGAGRYELLLDESHREHGISEQALRAILADLERPE